MTPKEQHLHFVQSALARAVSFSFFCRVGCVVMGALAGLLVLALGRDAVGVFGAVPVLAFWLLDAAYRRQSMLLELLYDHVRRLPDDSIDYSMDTSAFESQLAESFAIFFAPSSRVFYGFHLLALLLVILA